MIVVRFKVKCQPGKSEGLRSAFDQVIAPSSAVDGVITFDIARVLADSDSFVATEVCENQSARDRQESLPEVGTVMAILPEALAAPFHVSSSEPA